MLCAFVSDEMKIIVCLIWRCPDTNKPLGLMLLNGLTKLINEYKEVWTHAEQFRF